MKVYYRFFFFNYVARGKDVYTMYGEELNLNLMKSCGFVTFHIVICCNPNKKNFSFHSFLSFLQSNVTAAAAGVKVFHPLFSHSQSQCEEGEEMFLQFGLKMRILQKILVCYRKVLRFLCLKLASEDDAN